MRFERLTRGHVVAAVAALLLLLVMAMDWYGSKEADAARQATSGLNTTGAEGGAAGRAAKQDAQSIIARDEKNAWQEKATIDRVLLALLLLSVFLPLFAGAQRAAGRRPKPPWTPSALTAFIATAAALLLAYRFVNQPGNDAQTTIKLGAPIGLFLLAAIALGAASAFQGEASWAQMRQAAAAPPGTDGPASAPDATGRGEPASAPDATGGEEPLRATEATDPAQTRPRRPSA